MTGVTITVEAEGMEQLRKRLERLGLMGHRGLLERMSAAGESQTRQRLEFDKTDPEGNAWPALSPAYKTWKEGKKGSSGGLLDFEGNLINSVHAFVDDEIAGWGATEPYAAIHQFGGTSNMRRPGPAAIPAREYLGLSEGDTKEMMDIIDKYVDQILGL